MSPLDVPPPDPRLYAVLAAAGFGDDVFNPRQHRACELVERYALDAAIAVAERVGLPALFAAPTRVDDLVARGAVAPAFAGPLRWLVDLLAARGLAVRDDGGAHRIPAPLPPPARDALRAAILDAGPSYAPALALLDEAAAIHPRVARGETTGEAALFRRAALWFAYFDEAHGYYALNNVVSATAAAARLPARARVVEVGAGLGSATKALVARAADRIAVYRATEPVALFRRRAERTLAGVHPALAFAPLDVNGPWAAQGVAPESADLVWGVNVFHLARDLDAVLADATAALAPGGWLVVGEGLRPISGRPVAVELPFVLLESWGDVRLDPERRPTPGFLTGEEWLDALRRAGLAPLEVVPDAIALRAIHPGFFAAAVCGRKG
jgi:SAM-dependent methyltransferase